MVFCNSNWCLWGHVDAVLVIVMAQSMQVCVLEVLLWASTHTDHGNAKSFIKWVWLPWMQATCCHSGMKQSIVSACLSVFLSVSLSICQSMLSKYWITTQTGSLDGFVITVVSCKYAPPFATLALVQSAGGAYGRDATFSLAITPSLPVLRPQIRVQIEDNTFDKFAVAIWKDVIYRCGSPM